MKRRIGCAIIFLFFFPLLSAQVQQEKQPPENIRSVVFRGSNNAAQFPLVRMGERMTLNFDDLYADEADYYYRIVHCDHDWTPSELVRAQYLDGLDNQRIMQYRNSLASLQPYTAYTLELPNRFTRFRVSGNYMLEILDRNGSLVFSRRFVIYTESVAVGGLVKRSRDFERISTHQRVEFSVSPGGFELVNPQEEVKICLLQNSNFNTAITNLKPQFISSGQLIYKYDAEASFEGGNEYFNFDTKDIRIANNTVSAVELKNRYNHYLFTNTIRKNQVYTYFPDINGDFQIRSLDAVASQNNEADYSFVHFSLEYDPSLGLDEVFVYGKFNNYALEEENKMTYNEYSGTLETSIFLKQGFYNYKFAVRKADGTVLTNLVSGSHWETENEYLILVYYRNFGARYDSVIGIANLSSVNIAN